MDGQWAVGGEVRWCSKGMRERKIAVDLNMDDIHQSDRHGKKAGETEGGVAEGISPSPYATPSLWGFSPWTYWIFLSHSSSRLFGFRHFQHSSHLSTDNHYQSTGTSTEGQDFWPIHTLAYWGPKSLVCQHKNSIKTEEKWWQGEEATL